ncbi:MAG: translocation/assembly module TamB domain-containing protein [Opitutae bacterium]|nr:translocation/assembly module TamB domain-containing protein [Opitutae bacterium]
MLFILLALGVVTLPWWLGAVLRPLARAQGASFERYETVGYTRFRLHGITFRRTGVAFSAGQATLDTPALWLLRRARAHVEISDWALRLAPADAPAPRAQPAASPANVHSLVQHTLQTLRRWLPRLFAENGTIARGGQTWRIARATWADGVLRADGALPTRADVRATFTEKDGSFLATADLPSLAARAELAWTPNALRGAGTWREQPFTVDARFDDASWLPTRAELRAENWDLPAADMKLGPAYERVRGRLLARWADGAFTIDLAAVATPAGEKKAPPFELAAHATGDRRQIVIRTLEARAPFATATLSAPLTFSFDRAVAAGAAVLTVDADLGRQPWIDAVGKFTGNIRVVPSGADSRGEFRWQLDAFRWGKFAAHSGSIRGRWQWPRVRFDEIAVTLDAASRLAAHGVLDWPRRELHDARVDATLASAWAAPLLPDGVAFEKIVAAIEADGPLEKLAHRGELTATKLRANRLRPIELSGQWTGEALALREFSASAHTENATLRLAGSLDANRATVREFTLRRDGRELLHSVTPAEILWRPAWKISGVRLEGAESALATDLDWSAAPSFFVSGQKLPSEWFSDWWAGEIIPSRFETLNVRGSVHDGVLVGETAAEVAAQIDGEGWQGRLGASAAADGVRILQLELAGARGLMAQARGRVPVRVHWPRTPRVELDAQAPLELAASIAPDSPLWEVIRRQTGFAVDGGAIEANLSGSLAEPRGEVRIEARRIARSGDDAEKIPAEITALSATLRGQRDGLRLASLDAQIAGHPVHATGRLPMDDAAWRTLQHAPRDFDWRRVEAQLSVPRVELAALAHTFPALPFTAGTLGAQVQFARGEFTGHAELRDGATRPLPGLGRLLAVEADLALAGRRVDVRTFSAQLGGEPVQLIGTAALGARERPELDLRLQAKNVPLVRRPGLLVRTDLDLQAKTPERGPTRISGRVGLRDALVLADLAAILPGGPRGVAHAPPYFSVNVEPFSRWPLDVRIDGARAVRVRTAVFNGIATPQFQLTGTLGDPRAVGQLAVDEGLVLFPFARFAVQQGTVRLTAADPTQPQLAVNATAKRMGYELRLEAGGTTAAPTLTFSSNPPLESADILLLVTTGQPPKDEMSALTNQQRLTRLGTFLGSGIFQNFGGTEDRLEITSGEQVSEAGRETYRAEYKVTDKLSLTGEYDRYDDYNAGVSYRIYTKEGAKRDERKK